MNAVAVYARVSTTEQAERQTIENQRAYAESYCRLHGIEVVDWYADEAVSGAVPMERRPQGARLLADAAAGRFQSVLVYRIDRLARNTLELLRTVEALERCGVAVKSMSEPFETETHVGRFVITMLGSVAQLEKDTLRERSQLGQARTARNGLWNGGPPPYGYRLADRRLEVLESEAAVVRRIFALALEEMPLHAIATCLQAQGTPSPGRSRGQANGAAVWLPGTVHVILKNRTYAGEREYRKVRNVRQAGELVRRERMPESHRVMAPAPAIITMDEYEAAQRGLVKRMVEAKRNRKRFYLLTGRVRCALCGGAYVAYTHVRSTGEHGYYGCSRNSAIRGGKCRGKAIRVAEIEPLVWEEIVSFVREPGPVLERLAAAVQEQETAGAPVETQLEDVARALAGKGTERGRVIAMVRRGTITDAEGEAELRAIAAETELLELRRATLFQQQQTAQLFENRLVGADALLRRLRESVEAADDQTRREVVLALVESVVVHTDEADGKRTARAVVTYCFQAGPPSRVQSLLTLTSCKVLVGLPFGPKPRRLCGAA